MSTEPTTRAEADAAVVATVKAYAAATFDAEPRRYTGVMLTGGKWMPAAGYWFMLETNAGHVYVDSGNGIILDEHAVAGWSAADDLAPDKLQAMRNARTTALGFARCMGSGEDVHESVADSEKLTIGMPRTCPDCRHDVPLELHPDGDGLMLAVHDRQGRSLT